MEGWQSLLALLPETEPAFVLASEVERLPYRPEKTRWAVGILAGVVGAAALNLVPIAVSATAGTVLLFLARRAPWIYFSGGRSLRNCRL